MGSRFRDAKLDSYQPFGKFRSETGMTSMEISTSVEESLSYHPRRPWLAGLLSLFLGPVGQVYAGCLRRSICLWFIGACLLPILGLSAVTLPTGRFGIFFLCFCAVIFPIYLSVDAFLLAKRKRHAPLKRYQRWWAYVLMYVLFFFGHECHRRV